MTLIIALTVLYALGVLLWLCIPPKLSEGQHKPGRLIKLRYIESRECISEMEDE